MSPTQLYADVLLPFSLQGLYTYKIPQILAHEVDVGKRVVVQFGKKKIYSALVKTIYSGQQPDYDVKEIISVLDNEPVVNNKQYSFWEWIAGYYMCTTGEVMKAALPSGMRLESETRVFLNPDFDDVPELSETEEKIISLVQNSKRTTINDIKNYCGIKNTHKALARLVECKLIGVGEELEKVPFIKQIALIRLTSEYLDNEQNTRQLFEKLKNREKQLHLLMTWITISKAFSGFSLQPVSKKELLEKSGASDAVLKTMIKNAIFELYQKPLSTTSNTNAFQDMKELEPRQAKALDEIRHKFENRQVVLLHGVTSSGKTEIYIRLIKETLEKQRQVLYLLPEIALTTQIIQRLSAIFGNQLGVYHSRHSDTQRVEIWQRVLKTDAENHCPVILGVRSAVFLPFTNLGLVIVDEEHENTFKQSDPAPRFHARDAAIYLARIHQANVLLGTATPSFESYYNALTGKYGLVQLSERFGNMTMPRFIVSNVRKNSKNKSIFGNELIAYIEKALDNREQVILFQNRRGYAPYLECADCGWVPQCRNCDVSLTYHRRLNHLNCHYCGYTETTWVQCQKCGGTHVETKGLGTEQIEDEVNIRFPKARTARLDYDSTRGKYAYQKIIDAFAAHQLDILTGTQMVTKGLDFDHVSVVGIMNADSLMHFPDFRALEKSFQLMAQVGGRAGRKNKQGTVIIQTSQPEHPLFELVKENNYHHFYEREMADRQKFMYPPFSRLIRISVKHADYRKVDFFSHHLAQKLQKVFGNMVLGPESPPVSRISNKYIKNILLKLPKQSSLDKIRHYIYRSVNELMHDKAYQSVQIVYDVDPL